MKSEVVKLWVYERIRKKRRQLSLRIPATTRDQKKKFRVDVDVPLYTVRDNFITTAPFFR